MATDETARVTISKLSMRQPHNRNSAQNDGVARGYQRIERGKNCDVASLKKSLAKPRVKQPAGI